MRALWGGVVLLVTTAVSAATVVTSSAGPDAVVRPGSRAFRSCPSPLTQPRIDFGDGSAQIAEAGRLQPTRSAASGYASQHPDAFAGTGLLWVSAGDAVVFAAVARDVAVHAAALMAIVERPDELFVCKAVATQQESAALMSELDTELRSRASGWGVQTNGALAISLPEFEQAFAATLAARYGERVSLMVGRFPYPMPQPLPPSACSALPAGGRIPGMSLTVEQLAAPLRPTPLRDPTRATLRVRNRTSQRIRFEADSIDGTLVLPGTNIEVGTTGFYGLRPSITTDVDVPAGGEQTFTVVVGLTSCDPANGYAVPPGDYDLIVVIDRYETSPDQLAPLLSAPLRVRVEP